MASLTGFTADANSHSFGVSETHLIPLVHNLYCSYGDLTHTDLTHNGPCLSQLIHGI